MFETNATMSELLKNGAVVWCCMVQSFSQTMMKISDFMSVGQCHAVAGTTGKTNIGEIQKHCLLIGGFGIWLTRTELPEKTSATKTLCQNCKEYESTASAMFWLRYLGLKVHDDFIMQCCPNGYTSRFVCHTILWFVHVIHRMSTDIRSLHSSSPFC